jgi:hypothetical protein
LVLELLRKAGIWPMDEQMVDAVVDAEEGMDPETPVMLWEDMTFEQKLTAKFRTIRGWEFERARAWEDEINAYKAVKRYQDLMKAQEAADEHKKGLMTHTQVQEALGEPTEAEQAWEEAEIAQETSRGRRKILMRDYVSFKRTHVPTRDGQRQAIYGAVGARYWVGERGLSDLIAASGFIYQPVLKDDQDDALEEVKENFRKNVCEELQKRYGFEAQPDSLTDHFEWLVIWEVDENTVSTVKTFEQGWVRPARMTKNIRDLKGGEVSQFARQMGLLAPLEPHLGKKIEAPDQEEESVLIPKHEEQRILKTEALLATKQPRKRRAPAKPKPQVDEERAAYNRERGLADDA